MKTMHKIKTATLLVAAASFVLAGCHKEKMEELKPGPSLASATNQRTPTPIGNSSLTLKLTNTSPRVNYGAVNVELIGAVVHYSDKKTGATGYITLNVNARIYDLMSLSTDQVIIATGKGLPPSKIDQVRLIFGTHNTVVVASNLSRLQYPLLVHDPTANFANVTTGTILTENQESTILLDFNAIRSVNQEVEMEGHMAGNTALGAGATGWNKNIFFLEPQIQEVKALIK